MISHVTVGSDDLPRARAFYGEVLATLGLVCVFEEDDAFAFAKPAEAGKTEAGQDGAGKTDAGQDGAPWFWVLPPFDGAAASVGNGTHIAFHAPSRAAVHAFHAAALAGGGRDEGAPGPRPHYGPTYYAAYVRDPDGNKLQAVCRRPAEETE